MAPVLLAFSSHDGLLDQGPQRRFFVLQRTHGNSVVLFVATAAWTLTLDEATVTAWLLAFIRHLSPFTVSVDSG